VINEPRVIFADEPTGNLDFESAAAVIELLFSLAKKTDAALIVATHDPELANRTARTIRLRNGRVTEDSAAAK
jgi:putative ABC transport system ATP-binding protein